MDEEWRDIPGYEGYQASNLGNIRGCRKPGVAYGKMGAWKLLKPGHNIYHCTPGSKSVLHVTLRRDGKSCTFKVSHLVLMAFIGAKPDGMEACHRNDDRHDNRLENLRWDTHAENVKDAIRNNRVARGETLPQAVLHESDIPEILKMYQDGATQKSIAEMYHVDYRAIQGVVRNRNWKWIPRDGYTITNGSARYNGERSPRAKLMDSDIPKIIAAHRSGIGTLEIAGQFSVSICTIYSILNNQSWTHVNREGSI